MVHVMAQAEPYTRSERIIEDRDLPIVQCDYTVLKDVKSFGCGTSTVVETQGATDTFVVTWE